MVPQFVVDTVHVEHVSYVTDVIAWPGTAKCGSLRSDVVDMSATSIPWSHAASHAPLDIKGVPRGTSRAQHPSIGARPSEAVPLGSNAIAIQPVTYRGRTVAAATSSRFSRVEALDHRPAGDPDRVIFTCAYPATCSPASCRAPYSNEDAPLRKCLPDPAGPARARSELDVERAAREGCDCPSKSSAPRVRSTLTAVTCSAV